ncbi:MAG: RNA 3'-terminal phosphate cyclase [Candidatus Thorarchaeota archaeon]|nr:MAG: RNA 3'-terminal phosphate cyclase [Candidatus Thorarchaeota archaeon]
MIKIDGSHGEGGGQILRTSVALSALTMEPVQIHNIRAGRPNPGLRNQHIGGINLTGQLVSAEIEGLEVGSKEVTFRPQERRGGMFRHDVGTAGSISLVLQAVLPAAVLSPEPVSFVLRGGTDVAWSPPVDYMREVFIPILHKMGPEIEILQKKRGHYPRGGGIVECRVNPVEVLAPLSLFEFGNLKQIGGISHCVRLPGHIAERQASTAEKILSERPRAVEIRRVFYPRNDDPHLGPGSGIVLWAESDEGAIIGSDALGERRKRAEEVGAEAAGKLLEELATGRALDSHLCDMLVPYLAAARGTSIVGMTKITSHLETNIWAAHQILGVEATLEGTRGNPGKLIVNGMEISL